MEDTGVLYMSFGGPKAAGPPALGDFERFEAGSVKSAGPPLSRFFADKPWSLAERIRVHDSDITVEIEVDVRGFQMPEGDVQVEFEGRSIAAARFVPEESSPRGPHRKGTRVRLTIRLIDGLHWPDGEIRLQWKVKGWRARVMRVRVPRSNPAVRP